MGLAELAETQAAEQIRAAVQAEHDLWVSELRAYLDSCVIVPTTDQRRVCVEGPSQHILETQTGPGDLLVVPSGCEHAVPIAARRRARFVVIPRSRGRLSLWSPQWRPNLTDLTTYDESDLQADLRWWAAANYLTVAQIYLKSNPLLRQPLSVDDIKPRLLGHWGTSPGLSMIYTLLNRLIRRTGSPCLYVTGPGHGGPALVANAYLDGTYSEVYPAGVARPRRARPRWSGSSRPGRDPEPRQRADAGQHPRGRRARLRPGPRGGRGVRPSGPAGGLRHR